MLRLNIFRDGASYSPNGAAKTQCAGEVFGRGLHGPPLPPRLQDLDKASRTDSYPPIPICILRTDVFLFIFIFGNPNVIQNQITSSAGCRSDSRGGPLHPCRFKTQAAVSEFHRFPTLRIFPHPFSENRTRRYLHLT